MPVSSRRWSLVISTAAMLALERTIDGDGCRINGLHNRIARAVDILAESILDKEQRIPEIPGNIEGLLARTK